MLLSSVAFSPDGTILASGSYDNTVILWDVEKGQAIGQPLQGHEGKVQTVAFSPDGKVLASGSDDKTVILWDVESHQIIDRLSGHETTIRSVTFSPDGKILASGSFDKTIIFWDTKTHQPIGESLGDIPTESTAWRSVLTAKFLLLEAKTRLSFCGTCNPTSRLALRY